MEIDAHLQRLFYLSDFSTYPSEFPARELYLQVPLTELP
jgi:hypothetical protein